MMAHLYISLHQTPKAPYRVWANGDLVAECQTARILDAVMAERTDAVVVTDALNRAVNIDSWVAIQGVNN